MNTQMSVVTKLKLEWRPDDGEFTHVAQRMFRVATPSVEQWCADDGAHIEWDFTTDSPVKADKYLRSVFDSSNSTAIYDLFDDIDQSVLMGAVFVRMRRAGRYVEIWMAM